MRGLLGGFATDNVSHGRIDAESLSIIGVFVTRQTAVDRLPQHGHDRVACVLPGAGIDDFQTFCRSSRQPALFSEVIGHSE